MKTDLSFSLVLAASLCVISVMSLPRNTQPKPFLQRLLEMCEVISCPTELMDDMKECAAQMDNKLNPDSCCYRKPWLKCMYRRSGINMLVDDKEFEKADELKKELVESFVEEQPYCDKRVPCKVARRPRRRS